MAGNIDTLSIEIGASSDQAVESIKKITTALSALKTAASVNISEKFTHAVSGIAGATNAIKSENISKINQLATSLKKLEGLGKISISSKLPETIFNLAAAIDEIPEGTNERLTAFGDALKNLSGDKISISNKIPESLKAIGMAVWDISDAAIARLDQVTRALERLKGIDLKGVSNAMKFVESPRAKQEKESAEKPVEKPPKIFNAPEFNPGNGVMDDLKQIGKTFLSDINPAVKAFASLLKGALATIKKIASSVSQIAKNLAKATMKKIGNFVDKHALSDLKKMSGAVKNFMRSLGRIAFYRAIRSMIKAITDAFQEGLQNAYQFSASIETEAHRFAAAMDSMKAAGGTMKNQLGSAFISLLAAIAPIVNTIIALITRLAVALSQLFAAFTGGTYLRAKNLNAQMAADTAGGAAAAKEWKNQLMGFDEINRLEAPSDGGGGGGGGGIDPGDLFEEVEIDKSLKDFVDAFKEALMNGDWEGAGQMLAEKLNSLIPSEEQVAEWGKKLGYALNGAIQTAYYFLKYTDFKAIGERIGTFINNALGEIDFGILGRLWMKLKTSLWKTIMYAMLSVNWAQVAQKFSDFILGALDELGIFLEDATENVDKMTQAITDFVGNIKYQEIKDKVVEVLKKAFALVSQVIANLLPFDLGDNLSEGLAKAIKSGSDTKIAESVKGLLTLAFSGLTDLIASLLPDGIGTAFVNAVSGQISGGEGGAATDTIPIKTSIETLLTAAFTGLTTLIASLIPGLGQPVADALAAKINGDESGKPDTTNVTLALGQLITAAFVGLLELTGIIPPEVGQEMADQLAQVIADADFAAIHNIISYKIDEAIFGEKSAAKTWMFTKGDYAGKQIIAGMVAAANEGSGDIYEVLSKAIANPTQETLDELIAYAESHRSRYSTIINSIIEDLKEQVRNTGGYTAEIIEDTGEGLKVVTDTSNDITATLDATKDAAADAGETILGETETIVSGTDDAFDGVITKAGDTGTALDDLSKQTEDAVGSMTTAIGSGESQIVNDFGVVITKSDATGGAFQDMATEGSSAMGDLSGSVSSNSSSIISSLQRVMAQALATIRALNRVSYYGGGSTSRFNSGPTITTRASGGFVEDGLFMANHGEVVGTFSNGRTAVANNEQITNGIASAVYGAFMRAFGESGAGQGSSGPREISVNVNGREFYRATFDDFKSVQRERGVSLVANSY